MRRNNERHLPFEPRTCRLHGPPRTNKKLSPVNSLGGHSLTIDVGWRKVAEKALEFLKRFT